MEQAVVVVIIDLHGRMPSTSYWNNGGFNSDSIIGCKKRRHQGSWEGGAMVQDDGRKNKGRKARGVQPQED